MRGRGRAGSAHAPRSAKTEARGVSRRLGSRSCGRVCEMGPRGAAGAPSSTHPLAVEHEHTDALLRRDLHKPVGAGGGALARVRAVEAEDQVVCTALLTGHICHNLRAARPPRLRQTGGVGVRQLHTGQLLRLWMRERGCEHLRSCSKRVDAPHPLLFSALCAIWPGAARPQAAQLDGHGRVEALVSAGKPQLHGAARVREAVQRRGGQQGHLWRAACRQSRGMGAAAGHCAHAPAAPQLCAAAPPQPPPAAASSRTARPP